jgi:hypothetical protein
VVDIAPSRLLSAAGKGAGEAPDAHQVLELEGGTVPDLESGVIARAGQRDQPEPRQPPREGGIIALIRTGRWRAGILGRVRVAGRWGPFPAATVGHGTAVGVKEGQAPLGGRVAGERLRQIPGVGGVQIVQPGGRVRGQG